MGRSKLPPHRLSVLSIALCRRREAVSCRTLLGEAVSSLVLTLDSRLPSPMLAADCRQRTEGHQ
jgi:hypothetical protein